MIDLIHDVAEGYRKLVFATSYPGEIVSIRDNIANNTIKTSLNSELLLFAWMLLDAEVTFNVVGDSDAEITNLIQRLTYSKASNLDEADFIFIMKKASQSEKEVAVEKAKLGSLVDPHLSATIICEVSSVTTGEPKLLRGPGIESDKTIYMDAFDHWENLRGQKNKEFPLGIEMYFVDLQSFVLALPRTTQIVKGGM